MSKHTKGKLEVREYDGSMGSIDSEHEFMVAQAMQIPGDTIDHQTRIANTRRLVACWNACDGLPTDLLEHMVNPTSTYKALLKERNDLVKERDELVGILRRTVKYANRKPFNLTKEIDAVLTKYPEAS